MLSLQRCRDILGPKCGLDDQQIEKLRAQIYGIANVITDQMGKSKPRRPDTHQEIQEIDADGFQAALKLLTDEDREEIEERAAIIEFEAGTDTDEAERKAIVYAIRGRRENN